MPQPELTSPATALLAVAGVLAVANWWAVSVEWRKLEWLTKPAVMLFLIAAAVLLTPTNNASRAWIVGGLVFSLVGDVFLMLPKERFIQGVAAFFVAHVAYIVALLIERDSWAWGGIGAVFVAVMIVLVAAKVMRAVRAGHHPELARPVTAYVGVISAMVVAAAATTDLVAIAGAVFFYASDGILSHNKFVKPIPSARPLIMSTYHLGQFGLTLALIQ